jgi:hypothetical protein
VRKNEGQKEEDEMWLTRPYRLAFQPIHEIHKRKPGHEKSNIMTLRARAQ